MKMTELLHVPGTNLDSMQVPILQCVGKKGSFPLEPTCTGVKHRMQLGVLSRPPLGSRLAGPYGLRLQFFPGLPVDRLDFGPGEYAEECFGDGMAGSNSKCNISAMSPELEDFAGSAIVESFAGAIIQ